MVAAKDLVGSELEAILPQGYRLFLFKNKNIGQL